MLLQTTMSSFFDLWASVLRLIELCFLVYSLLVFTFISVVSRLAKNRRGFLVENPGVNDPPNIGTVLFRAALFFVSIVPGGALLALSDTGNPEIRAAGREYATRTGRAGRARYITDGVGLFRLTTCLNSGSYLRRSRRRICELTQSIWSLDCELKSPGFGV